MNHLKIGRLHQLQENKDYVEKIISDKFGCQLIERDNKVFIRYDSGQSASKMIESEITKEEAAKAVINPIPITNKAKYKITPIDLK